jgi:hypothetical protein
MNPTSQLDCHPDAESLNAFLEQALAERERTQILAHLAECGRCRQVVTLAQEAAYVETPVPSAARPAHSASGSNAWFRNWRFAWVPAAALAAVIALVVVIHSRPAQPGAELARVEPQLVPQNQGNASQASLRQQANANKAPLPASPAPARLAAKNLLHAPIGAAPIPPAELSVTSTPVPPEAHAIVATNAVHGTTALPQGASGVSGQGFIAQEASAQSKPEPAAAAWQQQQLHAVDAVSSRAAAAKATKARMASTAERAQASRGLAAASSAPQFALKYPSPVRFDSAMQQSTAGTLALGKTQVFTLPSGLASVSTAAALHRALAIDRAGTLFLSEDSGSHWQTVARQWAGRAVEVRAKQPLNANAGAVTSATNVEHRSGSTASPMPPATVFEIVNDSGLIWASADGKSWTEKRE